MELFVDLHIHTGLSPCGDTDMSPNNIVNMALLSGLDAIAITDHNSCENVRACQSVGESSGLTVIPGMELQTREEIHNVCLFESCEAAEEFQKLVYSRLPDIQNRKDLFGEQLIYGSSDEVLGEVQRMLLASADISFDEAFDIVTKMGGVFIPAHVDREAFSVINALGFMPDYLNIGTIEYKSIERLENFIKRGVIKDKYKRIRNSDAHYLQNILERTNPICTEENNIKSILEYLK